MKNKIFLIALLFIAISFSNKLYSIELDTVWVSDEYGQILFQHPVSKNILIAKNGITELDSKTGKFVRSFPIEINGIDMSPDGNKFLYSFSENIYIYDKDQEKIIEQIDFVTYGKFLTNETIVYRNREAISTIVKFNFITKIKQEIIPDFSVSTLATSPDGKYIAYATYEKNNTTDSKSHLYLMDAETMKEIKQLGSWDTEGKRIRSIHFSQDSKYLTFDPEYYNNNFPLNIYDVEKRNLLKTFNKVNFNFEYGGITLLGNNLFILNGANEFSLPKFKFELHNIEENKILFNLDEFALGGGIFNKELNHLYGTSKITMCLNISNIISSITPTNPINISYRNKTIIINPNNKLINNLTINTIEGREVFRQNFERTSQQNQIEIPLELSNGLHFINITSGSENFVHKLLIKE